jgi:hypothetical protein
MDPLTTPGSILGEGVSLPRRIQRGRWGRSRPGPPAPPRCRRPRAAALDSYPQVRDGHKNSPMHSCAVCRPEHTLTGRTGTRNPAYPSHSVLGLPSAGQCTRMWPLGERGSTRSPASGAAYEGPRLNGDSDRRAGKAHVAARSPAVSAILRQSWQRKEGKWV